MDVRSQEFIARSNDGMADPSLQKNLGIFRHFSPIVRQKAVNNLDDFEGLRQWTKEAKDKTLENLGKHLATFEKNVIASGGQVHWAQTPEDANAIIVEICRQKNAKNIAKGKSMISEEIALNDALRKNNFNPIETDLGEYIIQLANEPPSHIIGPAIHKTFEQVVDLFQKYHDLGPRNLDSVKSVMKEARGILRNQFLSADVGITGANYLIAETGTVGLVTNEGNGDLVSTLPKTHIVLTSIEKVVPDFKTAMAIQRLLVPSATAQPITCYTSFFTGPKKPEDIDGPEEFHVVLLDNKRSDILHSEHKDILRCIRCSACLNHCPIYTRTGGHAYGWVYPGPMGSVWSPLLKGLDKTHDLPNACTTCGRCAEVCPMDIPLPDMLRNLRHEEQEGGLQPKRWVFGMKLFMRFLQYPKLFQFFSKWGIRFLHRIGKRKGYFNSLLLANGWTKIRDFPAPQGNTFFAQLAKKESNKTAHDKKV